MCQPTFGKSFYSAITPIALYHSQYAILVSNYDGERSSYRWVTFIVGKEKKIGEKMAKIGEECAQLLQGPQSDHLREQDAVRCIAHCFRDMFRESMGAYVLKK